MARLRSCARLERELPGGHAPGPAEPCTGCHAPGAAGRGTAAGAPRRAPRRGRDLHDLPPLHRAGAKPLTMRGPASRSLPVEVHPVVVEDALYRSSELCGGCHQATFEEWKASPLPAQGERETCQGCHMPEVHRKVESVNAEPILADLRRDGEEAGAAPSSLHCARRRRPRARAFRRAARRHAGRARREPPAACAAHRQLRAARGQALRVLARRHARVGFAARPGSPLAAGESREVELPLEPGARGSPVAVSLRRFDPGTRTWQELARAAAPPIR